MDYQTVVTKRVHFRYAGPGKPLPLDEEKAMTDKPTRGGSREGAGRKPIETPRRMVSVRLSEETIAYLSTTDSKTEAIEAAIQNTKKYKQWKANRPRKGE